MKIKFNGQLCEVRICGKRYTNNLNGQGEGGGYHEKYGLFDESGNKIGAVTGGYLGNFKIIQNGKSIGSINFNPDNIKQHNQ